MNDKQVNELLLQSLEHEMGGVQVYEQAIACAVNNDLKKEWEKYLQETRNHVTTLETLCSRLAVDSSQQTPGRQVVRFIGQALVQAMEKAQSGGDRAAAQ